MPDRLARCNKITFFNTPGHAILTHSRRRPRGLNIKRPALQQSSGGKGFTLPEYLEAREVSALLAAVPNPEARLLILAQCAQSVYSGAAHLLCGCPRLFYDVASQIEVRYA